jgi:hypothetical protein
MMTAAAKNSFGASLWFAADGVTPLVKLADVDSIKPATIERGMIDVTTHDSPSNAREYIPEGVYEPGEIEVQGNLVAGSTGEDALRAGVTGGGKLDAKLVLKAASGTEDETCECYAMSYSRGELTIDGKQRFSSVLKVTGPATQGPSA